MRLLPLISRIFYADLLLLDSLVHHFLGLALCATQHIWHRPVRIALQGVGSEIDQWLSCGGI